jgi:sulfate-transporting ATPase
VDAKVKRASQEARDEEGRQKVLEREKAWMGTSAKGQRVKNSARIKQYEEMMTASENQQPGSAQIIIPTPPRLGENVIEGKNITKAFGDKMLIEGLNFKLPRGGIVGVIGPNGAGKTTLFRMITGAEKPDTGEMKIGDSVKLGYVDQSRDALDANKTVWEEISEGNELLSLGKRTMQSRAYVSSFNFKGSDQQKKVGMLSGGERNRVHLAKMLKSDANVLLLDEPTNDLDVDTLRALEDAMLTYPGCAVIISHDRWFLDRISTHILAFEGDSHVEWFEGNYGDYEADRVRRLGDDAATPHRIKYKPLVR